MEEKLQILVDNVKQKNPSLFTHICKEVQRVRLYNMHIDMEAIRKSKRKATGSRSRTSGRSRLTRTSANTRVSDTTSMRN